MTAPTVAAATGVITWEELKTHNSLADLWVAVGGKAYDITRWARQHPGGEVVLEQYAGRDATDVFLAMHGPNVSKMLPAYLVGSMESDVKPGTPPTAKAYRELHSALKAEGLFTPRVSAYIPEAVGMVAVFCLLHYLAFSGFAVAAGLTMALFWQMIAYVGHDAGHHIIYPNRSSDSRMGMVVTAFIGIGHSWWAHSHNVHHVSTNSVDCDPDIQHMPFFAISPLFFKSLFSRYHNRCMKFDWITRQLVSIQHITYLPILMTFARFNLYAQTIGQVLFGKVYYGRLNEGASLVFFISWFTWVISLFADWQTRALFTIVAYAAAGIHHLMFSMSHFSCHVYEGVPDDRDWVRSQVTTTTNYTCHLWLDWICGGLQFQIEHHLFPRLPRHNLRKISARVQRLCKEHNIEYSCPSFLAVAAATLRTLQKTGMAARSLDVVTSAKVA